MEAENIKLESYEEDPLQIETVSASVHNKSISELTLEEHKYFMTLDANEEQNKELKSVDENDVTVVYGEESSWNDLCRICANVNDHLIPIFKGEGLQNQFSTKINKYLPIQVCENDALPQQLCYQCAAILIAWHKLSENSLASEVKLQKMQLALQKAQEEGSSLAPNEQENNTFETVSNQHPIELSDETLKDNTGNESNNKQNRSTHMQTSFKMLLEMLNAFWKPFRKKHIQHEKKPDMRCESNSVWITMADSNPQQSTTISEDDASESSNHCDDPVKTMEENESKKVVNVPGAKVKKTRVRCVICAITANKTEGPCEHVKRAVKQEYQCTECGKRFKLKDSYIRHMRIHKDERPFTCHVCGKQFRDSGGLSRHLKDVHAKVKKFMCDICGRFFASKATKEDHRRTHTGERPYICDSCGKTFKSKACLYTHCKLHTDEYPHPCTHCNKKFRRRQEMLAHITTHTGEKNYPCDVCSKRFRVKSELVRHKLVHSESKPFVCVECGLAFRQKRYLNNHIKSRHVETSRSC